MILADKIIEERKKNGWSQEELAEQLGVSRQAVSKWESAGSVPDLQRVIQLAELFGVSTDYLLKDEMLPQDNAQTVREDPGTAEPVRRVSMEEANAFIDGKKKNAPVIANAVSMCILSPVLIMVLGTMADDNVFNISEPLAAVVGFVFLFGMIAVAVFMFINCGIRGSHLEHIEKECFETEYGVSGMVKERLASYEPVFARGLAFGVVLCIISVIPLIVAGALGAADHVCGLFAALMFLMIAVGVNIIIRTAMVKGCYDALLQEGDYTRSEKRSSVKTEGIMGAYWMVAVAVYLVWSFLSGRWDITWVVWPVAGVLSAVVKKVFRLISEE